MKEDGISECLSLSVKCYICIFRKGRYSIAALDFAFVGLMETALPQYPLFLRQGLSLQPKLAWASHPPASASSGVRVDKHVLPHPTRPFIPD